MMQKAKEEPVMLAMIAAQIVNYAGRYGLELPPEMVADSLGLVMLLLAFAVRRVVSPAAKQKRLSQAPPAA